MFCYFCGKEIRDGAVFCSECGKNQTTGQPKKGISKKSDITIEQKRKKTIFLGILAVVLIVVGIIAFSSKSIVGVWMSGTMQISFTSDGQFKRDATYGTYTIDDDKTLILDAGEYSYRSGVWEYEYSEKAIEEYGDLLDDGYWYIKGNTLYLNGNDFVKR